MDKWLNAKVGDIEDELFRELIVELTSACGIYASSEAIICHFLVSCVYPLGTGTKRVPISTDHLPASPLLETPIGRLPSGPVFDLCRELARDEALEFFHGERLRNFLNRRIPKFPEQKPLSETARRKAALVHMRRGNR